MELKAYLEILWRRKWVIVGTAVVTVAVVAIGTLMMTPQYEATTTLRLTTATGGSVEWVNYDVTYTERLMNTYVKIGTSGPVLAELGQQLDLDELPQIDVEILANTELMQITVEDENPVLAAALANALAEILVAQSRELYTGDKKTAQDLLDEQLAQLEQELIQARQAHEMLAARSPQDSQRITTVNRSVELKQETYAVLLEQREQARIREVIQTNTLSVIEPAVIPEAPSKPRKALNIALGVMVGLGGGIGLAFLFENLDSTLYTTEQIETATKVSTLGKIPTAKRQQQITFLNGHSAHGEAFRRLRTNIFIPDRQGSQQTLLITSAEPGEGKSTTIANLAYAIAQSGQEVIVVDGDLRRPTLHRIFDLPNEIGLSSVLRQDAVLAEVVQVSHISGVQVLTSGPLPSHPAELLGSPHMAALIEQLKQQFDLVLLDTPALLAVTDAAVLAPLVDGVLLVVGRAQTRQEAVRAARQQLTTVKARLVGIVVNRAEQDHSYDYYYPPKTNPV